MGLDVASMLTWSAAGDRSSLGRSRSRTLLPMKCVATGSLFMSVDLLIGNVRRIATEDIGAAQARMTSDYAERGLLLPAGCGKNRARA
jgi:hypothetical protein